MPVIGNAVANAGIKIKDQLRTLAVQRFAERQKWSGRKTSSARGEIFLKSEPQCSIFRDRSDLSRDLQFRVGGGADLRHGCPTCQRRITPPSGGLREVEVDVDTA